MADDQQRAITFIVPGERGATTRGGRPSAGSALGGRVKDFVRVGISRGATTPLSVTASPGDDVVVLHVVNGPSLVLHPETARDLLLAQSSTTRGSATRGGADAGAPTTVDVPTLLRWRGLEDASPSRGAARGFLGDVLLAALEVITGRAKDAAADLAATAVVKRIDGQVVPGVYALRPEVLLPLKASGAQPVDVAAGDPGKPVLVLVHGTFVETSSTFGRLWTDHPDGVRRLFGHYDGRVYALDHPTLGVSPITNALTLAKSLPAGARVHLLTHSRGGLVAEVLARVCGRPQLTDDDRRWFATDDAAEQRADLERLAAIVAERRIAVERVVRVACPAHGTLLASQRLDAYVSVFRWTLELAGIPVLPALVDFLGEVAQRRRDRNILPGLEAMTPDNPLVQWLHAVPQPVAGDLRVVAGDIQGDSVVSWLKTLLADAFYWTDNDLVVQTRSMYGGSPRADGATFVLDQGGKVTHFDYFRNQRTADAVVAALADDQPVGFRTIGPLSWSGQSAAGVRAARDATAAADKPAVFVLPGILGSNLKVGDDRIWLSWHLLGGLGQLRYPDADGARVEPDGAIEMVYEALERHLAKTHEVVEFAFDWRRPMEEEARRLADAVTAALDARRDTGQPVRIVAHSMGGLLARTMQLECPAVWDRMLAHEQARVLMLGTPNAGSWAPMQVLSGDDTFGNTIVGFGSPFRSHAGRQLVADFPGFLQLQASLADDRYQLGDAATWQRLAADDLKRVKEYNWWHDNKHQMLAYEWGEPSQAVLDAALALWRRLDDQRATLHRWQTKLVLVIGRAKFTPEAFELGDKGLVYLNAPQTGDGRVTLTSALLPGVRTWQLDCDHGSLPQQKDAFPHFLRLLEDGAVASDDVLGEIDVAGAAAQPEAIAVRSRPSRSPQAAVPPEEPAELYAREPTAASTEPATSVGPALRVGVVNGDVNFVQQPLVIGHYTSLQLTGTERVVDRAIGGTMRSALALDRYPDAPGTHAVFLNTHVDPTEPWRLPRPEAAIVVGLGEEGALGSADIVRTVRRGVLAWIQSVVERTRGVVPPVELAATLLGSGGVGMSAGAAAQAIAEGVQAANASLREWNDKLASGEPASPTVAALSLIELYGDRAAEAWRALQALGDAAPGRYDIAATVSSGQGALPRPIDADYRGTSYDLISAVAENADGQTRIAYALDTRRARTDIRAQSLQGRLVQELVRRACDDRSDVQIGRTLFDLLVPPELEPYLAGTRDMVIDVDPGTAGIPWEMLDTDRGLRDAADRRPWAIRAKLLRKLRVREPGSPTSDARADQSVLVVGEPLCDEHRYPRLPGARAEAATVVRTLTAVDGLARDRVWGVFADDDAAARPDAVTVIRRLMERDWRIVHLAGHGEPPLDASVVRGMVLSDDTFLGPQEFRQLRTVPELVFVNCCYLGARDPAELLQDDARRGYDRPRAAATIAAALIEMGVRCVVAAGWAVDDAAALAFAGTFYQSLMSGCRFLDAVARAREAAFAKGGNTWAAYQCYGDPNWQFRKEVGDAQRPASPPEEFADVATPTGLCTALETLAVGSTFQHAPAPSQKAKLRHLEARFDAVWGGLGRVAEAFGLAWLAAGDRQKAVAWLTRAAEANDGGMSAKGAEQLGNVRVRVAWETVAAASRRANDRTRAAGGPKRRAGGPVAAATVATARAEIAAAIAILQRVADLASTIERESLLGSAYKRLAMVEHIAGRSKAEADALVAMRRHYRDAEEIARTQRSPNLFYPALNRLAAEIVLQTPTTRARDRDPLGLEAVRESLARRVRDDPDFWSVVAVVELHVYEALGRRDLAGRRDSVLAEYADIHGRVSAPWMWASVYDQAVFVLARYAASARADERAAAEAVLNCLATYAGARQNGTNGAAAADPTAHDAAGRKIRGRARVGRTVKAARVKSRRTKARRRTPLHPS